MLLLWINLIPSIKSWRTNHWTLSTTWFTPVYKAVWLRGDGHSWRWALTPIVLFFGNIWKVLPIVHTVNQFVWHHVLITEISLLYISIIFPLLMTVVCNEWHLYIKVLYGVITIYRKGGGVLLCNFFHPPPPIVFPWFRSAQSNSKL